MLLRLGDGSTIKQTWPAPALMKCHNDRGVQWLTGTEQPFKAPNGTLNGVSNLEIAIAIRWTPHFRTARAGDDRAQGCRIPAQSCRELVVQFLPLLPSGVTRGLPEHLGKGSHRRSTCSLLSCSERSCVRQVQQIGHGDGVLAFFRSRATSLCSIETDHPFVPTCRSAERRAQWQSRMPPRSRRHRRSRRAASLTERARC